MMLAMLKRLSRLFVIKTRFEAYAVIYALAVGAIERGLHYLDQYPGFPGYLLLAACTGAVFMAGAKILDATPSRKPPAAPYAGAERRRQNDRRAPDRHAPDRRQPDRRQPGSARPA